MRRWFVGGAQRGFTLLELMTVVAVAAVLAAVAAPSLKTFIDNQRLRNASFDLVSDLLLARSEALKRGGATVVVITPTATPSDGWSDGWSVNIGSSAGETVTSRTGVASQLRFAVQNSSGSLGSLSIGSDGRVIGGAPITIDVKFTNPAPSGITCSRVRIDATGRAKSEKGSCS